MKVLMLVIDKQRIQLESLYEGIAKNCTLDLRRLSSEEQSNLASYFKKHVCAESYDRIILFLRFKKEIRQVAFIRTIPNLVILEHDAWQNYYSQSKYKGKFSRHYSALPWARVVVSGATLAERLSREGVDAKFVPKGYNQELLRNMNQGRPIKLGFVGNIEHDTYRKRKELLQQAIDSLGLIIKKTNSGEDYLIALNKIRFFISADIGFSENMVKNFEAMACGCLLIAYNQGDKENSALGFKDMENVVLYDDFEMLEAKINLLNNNEKLADSIAAAGQLLAESVFPFDVIGKRVVDETTPQLRIQGPTSVVDYLRYFFRR
nr:glycosyltransferase family 1 protein [Rhodospirillales bacterium]